jgi:hypothetical protein
MFLDVCVCSSRRNVAVQAVEEDIVLQAGQKSTRSACVEALRGKFAAAALLKTNSKAKVVS